MRLPSQHTFFPTLILPCKYSVTARHQSKLQSPVEVDYPLPRLAALPWIVPQGSDVGRHSWSRLCITYMLVVKESLP